MATAQGTFLIAIDRRAHLLVACEATEAALRTEIASYRADCTRETEAAGSPSRPAPDIRIYSEVTLTDTVRDGDEVVYEGPSAGWLTDGPSGTGITYRYAVLRTPGRAASPDAGPSALRRIGAAMRRRRPQKIGRDR